MVVGEGEVAQVRGMSRMDEGVAVRGVWVGDRPWREQRRGGRRERGRSERAAVRGAAVRGPQ